MQNPQIRRWSHLGISSLTLLVLGAALMFASPSADAFQASNPGHSCWDQTPGTGGGEYFEGQCYKDFGPPTCEEGLTFVHNPSTGEHCVSVEEPVVELINCPSESLSSADGCYVLVPKGPRGAPYCENGVLAGTNCVIVGQPISTRAGTVCPPGFGWIDGKCLRYETPVAPAPECPVGSVEDEVGDCRKPVPGGNKQFTCANPAAELTAQGCVATTMPSVCATGGMVIAHVGYGCNELMAGPYCAGQLVTINLYLTPTSVGTTGDDVVWGTAGDDVFFGLGGNDIVCAGAGNDLVMTGHGNDMVFGEDGDDRLHLRGGNDEGFGGAGDDYLDGFLGKDHCDGGSGYDVATDHCESATNVS